jgi:hypothetical protein
MLPIFVVEFCQIVVTLGEKLVILLQSRSRTQPPHARLLHQKLATTISSAHHAFHKIKLCALLHDLSLSKKNIQERLWAM